MIVNVIVRTIVGNPSKLEEGIQVEIADNLDKDSIEFNNEIDRQVKEWFSNKIIWRIGDKPNAHLSPMEVVSSFCGANSNIMNELKKVK